MAFPPVAVFVGGRRLTGYTGLTLSRSKENLTGSLNIDLFFSYVPTGPVILNAAVAQPVNVYIGGHLAFTGFLDARTGSAVKHGATGSQDSDITAGAESGGSSSRSWSIGPNEYTVKLSARGKTKYLLGASHQETKNLLRTSNREILDKLLQPFGVQLEFIGTEIKVDKARLRDGALVIDEINRVATEYCHYIYETRDGKLRVTDDIGIGSGEPLILGQNILSCSAEQSEAEAKSEITVKGQRTPKEVWGQDAILDKVKIVTDAWVSSYCPITVQMYGDATDEQLERRARFEANKHSSRAKTVSIDVFHVQSRSGAPWDVGQLHYVEIPPEGIFETFECTAVNYTVTNDKELKTTLTLSPPPAGGGGGIGGGLLSFSGVGGAVGIDGAARRAAAGITIAAGQFPAPWTGPSLAVQTVAAVTNILAGITGTTPGLASFDGESEDKVPPLMLPQEFEE